jgi:hypothetical protein
MNKNTRLVLIVAAVLAVGCCGGGALVCVPMFQQAMGLVAEAKTAGEEAVTAIGKTWDAKELRDRATTGYKRGESEDETKARLAAWSEKLGPLVSVTLNPGGASANASTGSGRTVSVPLSGTATGEKGTASVTLRLVRQDDGPWQIDEITVN